MNVQEKTRVRVSALAPTFTLIFVVPAGETSNFFEDLARCQAALKALRTSPVFELVDPKKAEEI